MKKQEEFLILKNKLKYAKNTKNLQVFKEVLIAFKYIPFLKEKNCKTILHSLNINKRGVLIMIFLDPT